MGKLMYQQNNFKACRNILDQFVEQCKEYSEHYYSIFAQGYLLRSELRLGKFNLPKFY